MCVSVCTRAHVCVCVTDVQQSTAIMHGTVAEHHGTSKQVVKTLEGWLCNGIVCVSVRACVSGILSFRLGRSLAMTINFRGNLLILDSSSYVYVLN